MNLNYVEKFSRVGGIAKEREKGEKKEERRGGKRGGGRGKEGGSGAV